MKPRPVPKSFDWDCLGWIGLILAAIAVVALASNCQGQTMSRSDNFIVFAPDQSLGEEVLDRAEQLREQIASEWFGEELPDCAGRTLIHVRLSDTEDSGLTWIKNTSDPKQTFHRTWLTTTREQALGSMLAHEMVHAVFATRFPQGFPAWIEEGIAGLYDGPERKADRRRIVKGWAKSGRQPDRDRILQAKGFAVTDSDAYCVSCYLVESLLAKGDRNTLIRFAMAWQSGRRWALLEYEEPGQ